MFHATPRRIINSYRSRSVPAQNLRPFVLFFQQSADNLARAYYYQPKSAFFQKPAPVWLAPIRPTTAKKSPLYQSIFNSTPRIAVADQKARGSSPLGDANSIIVRGIRSPLQEFTPVAGFWRLTTKNYYPSRSTNLRPIINLRPFSQ